MLRGEAFARLEMKHEWEHEERELDGHQGLPLRGVSKCRMPQQHGSKAGIEQASFFD